MADYKLDMYNKLLPELDKRNFLLWQQLSEDERKGFSDIVTLRNLSTIDGGRQDIQEYYLCISNSLVNRYLWHDKIRKNPELVMQLMSVCGLGEVQRHKWIPGTKNKKKTGLVEKLSQLKPESKLDELELWLEINTAEDIIEYFESAGFQEEEIKELKKEVKKFKK